MNEFFVKCPLLLLLYQIYVLFGLLSKKFMKKSKKHQFRVGFFGPEPVDRFTSNID
jgi:hypothetical protein